MSVRVNLLPRETHARQAAARQRTGVVLGLVALVALLGAVFLWQMNRVDNARAELAQEEERTDELRAEVAALQEFDELRERQREAEEAMQTTLSGEASVAGILQDLAAVMPDDAQIDTLNVTVGEEATDDATGEATVGTFTATGKTLTSHAPGVERVLLSLDKVASFVDLFVNSSALDDPDEDTATFSVEGKLGPEVLTERYLDGLPEDLR